MNTEVLYCPVCKGVGLQWNEQQGWVAPYVEGGVYCRCSDEELNVRSRKEEKRTDSIGSTRGQEKAVWVEERIDSILRWLRP